MNITLFFYIFQKEALNINQVGFENFYLSVNTLYLIRKTFLYLWGFHFLINIFFLPLFGKWYLAYVAIKFSTFMFYIYFFPLYIKSTSIIAGGFVDNSHELFHLLNYWWNSIFWNRIWYSIKKSLLIYYKFSYVKFFNQFVFFPKPHIFSHDVNKFN